MTYQVLARKWRPSDFDQIVGQEPIVQALRNGLKDNRIAQAYLFSGIRGVGKTTAARVLAKALNCQASAAVDLPAADPCNNCSPCLDISNGQSLDVLEVDAATYSKVEQIRELTESLKYGPASCRYKVVVLDEVHRLSRQAFDALLKIVEEPPAHLVFIFATTESEAIPATIHSRCQEFQFRRVNSSILAQHLKRISAKEEIEVSSGALRTIARAGEGSVRDSVALLDQLATFGSGTIADQDAASLLGGLDLTVCEQILQAILERNSRSIIRIVSDLEDRGSDPQRTYSQFLSYLEDALHLHLTEDVDSVDLPAEDAKRLVALTGQHGFETVFRLTHQLLSSESTIRHSEFGLLALKLTWLRAAELTKLTSIEEVLNDPNLVTPRPEYLEPKKKSITEPKAKNSQPTGNQTARASVPENSTKEIELIAVFRRHLEVECQSIAALLHLADISISNNEIIIHPAHGDSLLTLALNRSQNSKLVSGLVRKIFGVGYGWSMAKPKPPERLQQPTLPDQESDPQTQNDIVKVVLDIFQGNVKDVHDQR